MHTYEKIALDYRLWQEFVDPHNTMTQAEFDALTIKQKIEIQVATFGIDQTDNTYSEIRAI